MHQSNSAKIIEFELSIFNFVSAYPESNSHFLNVQLSKLYVSYLPMARSLAYKFHLDSDLANDVLQDGILLLLDRIRNGNFEFNPELGFRSFLYRAFQNLSANTRKRASRFVSADYIQPTVVMVEKEYMVEQMPPVYPEGAMEERVSELLNEKMGQNAARVLELCLIRQKSNEEGASMMGYKDESIFRKKKSQHLKNFRSRINREEKKELLRMAS